MAGLGVGLLLAMLGSATTASAQNRVIEGTVVTPLPQVTGPIPETATSHPFNGAAHSRTPIDLAERGYLEEEYFVGGRANVYNWPQVGRLEAFANGPYETRILVRRPIKQRRFSGNVIVEMNNPTSVYDVDIMWEAQHEHFLRQGDAWVGITVKPVVLGPLKTFDPGRYGSLAMDNPLPLDRTCPNPTFQATPETETGLAWDMVSQIGALLKSDEAANPLAGLGVERLYLTGYSQTGGYVVVYVNAIAPHFVLADGSAIFDGYLNAAGGGFPPPINQCAGFGPRFTVQPVGEAPVISIQTESDFYGLFRGTGFFARRPDGDATGNRYRLYEVPGSAHVWANHVAFTPARDDLEAAGFPRNDWDTFCFEPNTNFPLEFVMNAAFRNLDVWARTGKPAPRAARIQVSDPTDPAATTLTDSFGNALGGLRTPYLDVPIATYLPTTEGPITTSCSIFWGHQEAFSQARLIELYGTKGNYVRQVRRSAQQLVRDGWLTRADAREIVRQARQVELPSAGDEDDDGGEDGGDGDD